MKLNLAENISAFRKSRGFTLERLAEALGVTVSAVHKWESGRTTPDIERIVEMARLFETSVDVLLDYEGYPDTADGLEKKIKAMYKENDLKRECLWRKMRCSNTPTPLQSSIRARCCII